MTITKVGYNPNAFKDWYASWEGHYVPYLNPFRKPNDNQDIEFLTDERSKSIVRKQNPRRVWSYIRTSDYGQAIVEGFVEDNAIFYYVTKYKRPRNSKPVRIQVVPDEINQYIP